MDKNIVILCALQLESRAVARALGFEAPCPGRPTGRKVAAASVSLHLIGIRARDLSKIQLVQNQTNVVLAGMAGALDPLLRVGDLVVSSDPPELTAMTNFHTGRIHTATELIDSPRRKAILFAATGADAVDMETEVVHHWAKQHDARFTVVRSISDSATEALDADFIHVADDWGRVRAGRLAGFLISNPRRVAGLLHMARNAKVAARQLGIAVKEIVIHLATSTGPASSADCAPQWFGQ